MKTQNPAFRKMYFVSWTCVIFVPYSGTGILQNWLYNKYKNIETVYIKQIIADDKAGPNRLSFLLPYFVDHASRSNM